MRSSILPFVIIFLLLWICSGYVGIHWVKDRDKAMRFCDNLMRMPLPVLILWAPGEANACLDIGVPVGGSK